MKAEYIVYWLVGDKHCELAEEIRQCDGKIAYVCKHTISKEVK